MDPETISTLAVKQQNSPLQESAPSSKVDEDFSVKRKSSFEVEASSLKVDDDKVNMSLAVKLQSLSFQEGASNSKINDGDDLLVRHRNPVMFGGVPPANLRYKKLVVRPIIHGSKAWPLFVKRDDGHTHIWTVYLKPFLNEEDISKFVKCVQFKLHESYANQIRIVHAPPYQVIETGCLEFEVEIEISFWDKRETPVTLFHSLKLSDGVENDGNVNMSTDSVTAEFFHQLIFEDPTPRMLKLLKHPTFQPGKEQRKIHYKEEKVGDLEKLTHTKSSFQGGASNIKVGDDGSDKILSFQGGASNTKVNAWDDEINEGLSIRQRNKIIFDEAPDASGRYKNVEVSRAIVYGSEVWLLCEERVDGHTHEWTVYVKPFINEDMSRFIKRVQFKLHETYENQIRVCHAPPYQVTETGWGEFMLEIVIFFQDDNEEPVTIFHFLKFPDGEDDDGFANIKSEFYHELIFRNPTEKMLKLLKHPKLLPGEAQHNIDCKKKEVYDLEKLKQQKSSFKGVASKIKVGDRKVNEKLPNLLFQEGASESFSVRQNKVTLEEAPAAKKKEVYDLKKLKQQKSSFKGVASKIKVGDRKVNEKLPNLLFQEGASESFSVRQNKVTLEEAPAAKKKEVYDLKKLKQQKSSFKGVASKIKVGDRKVNEKLPNLLFQEGASESFSVRQNKVTLEEAPAAKKKEVYDLDKLKQQKSSFKGVASKIKVGDKKVNEKLPSLSFQEGASESVSVRPKNKVIDPDASGRRKNVEVSRAIVYGSEVWPLGEKVGGVYTHQWTVYLKPFLNEDMSKFVKRVQFKLDESYTNQIRVCYAPPYQVTEMGWEGFEVEIEIFFQDDKENPVTLFHNLKFSDREDDGNANMNTNPISSEFYDELIFRNPTKKMYKLLKHPKFLPGEAQHKIDYKEKKACDLEKILAAKLKIKAEVAKAKAQFAYKIANIEQLKTHVVDEHGTVIVE